MKKQNTEKVNVLADISQSLWSVPGPSPDKVFLFAAVNGQTSWLSSVSS